MEEAHHINALRLQVATLEDEIEWLRRVNVELTERLRADNANLRKVLKYYANMGFDEARAALAGKEPKP